MLKKLSVISVVFIFVMSIASVLCIADIQSELDTRNKQLSQVKQNINKKKTEKDKLVKEEQAVLKELKKITDSINRTERQIRNLDTKIKKTEKSIDSASDKYSMAGSTKIKYYEKIKEEYHQYNKEKLVYGYKYPVDFTIRRRSLKYKSKIYTKEKSEEENAQKDITSYSRQKAKLTKLKEEQNKLKQQNLKLQQNKNAILKKTSSKRVKAEQEIRDLNDTAQAMQELVNKLNTQNRKSHPITSARSNTTTRRNNLPWPVEGNIVLDYGKNKHPTLNTNIISNGIKIKAKNNDIIKAVDDGVVVFSGFFRSYGNMVIVDHKEIFYSIYGQLDKISVEEKQEVKRGTPIATVGSGDNSVLYFEIRQYNVSENPLLWLKEKQ